MSERVVVTREAVLERCDPAGLRWVDCPELGDGAGMYVGPITGRQLGQLMQAFSEDGIDLSDRPAWLVARATFDQDGERVFEDGDESALSDARGFGPVLLRLFNKAIEVNGLNQAGMDDIEKNSESAQIVSGGSTSRGN